MHPSPPSRSRASSKTYPDGFQALKNVDLEIRPGEIFALLGPNGAGKTTLISVVCGIVNPGGGTVRVEGHDILRDFRAARSIIGLVPQELTVEHFESVIDTVKFSRGLFGKAPDPAHIEKVLRDLSLWDKRDNRVMELSGGMKRRVMIAKALSHEPKILFLDEPTAGVDVELRRDMWEMVRKLRESGVTIILTTHYIEEAEEMADRVGVINHGEIVLVEEKNRLMKKLGKKQLAVHLRAPLEALPHGAWRSPARTHRGRLHARLQFRRAGGRIRHSRTPENARRSRHRFSGSPNPRKFARGYLRQSGEDARMTLNLHAIRAIYVFEMARTFRTLMQSIASPVISTSLYFVVFGAAIGSRIQEIDGISYGAFIIPGLIMLSLLTESISNASFGIYMPKYSRHHLRNPLRAHLRRRDRDRLCRRGGDEVADPRHPHPHHRALLRRLRDPASLLDGALPRPHGAHLLHVRLRARRLGRQFSSGCRSCPC